MLIIIYGNPGIGKTTLSTASPDCKLFAFEGKIKDAFCDAEFVEVPSELPKKLIECKHKTAVIDSYSSWETAAGHEMLAAEGNKHKSVMDIPYGKGEPNLVARYLDPLLSAIRKRSNAGLDTIIVGHIGIRESNDLMSESYKKESIAGLKNVVPKLISESDEVWYLRRETVVSENRAAVLDRELITDCSHAVDCKSRLGLVSGIKITYETLWEPIQQWIDSYTELDALIRKSKLPLADKAKFMRTVKNKPVSVIKEQISKITSKMQGADK